MKRTLTRVAWGEIFDDLATFTDQYKPNNVGLADIEVCGGVFSASDRATVASFTYDPNFKSSRAFSVPVRFFKGDVDIEWFSDSLRVNNKAFCDYRKPFVELAEIKDKTRPVPFVANISERKQKTAIDVDGNVAQGDGEVSAPAMVFDTKLILKALKFVGGRATYRVVGVKNGEAGCIESGGLRVYIMPLEVK